MSEQFMILSATAAFIGFVHTLVGPDHYVPFIAMAGARKWTLRRTLGITAVCGVGHVAGSVVLGLIGISFGWSLGKLTVFENVRGNLAGWLLLGFGLAYLVWGLHRAIRNRPHIHLHVHADQSVHTHVHSHVHDHVHVHDSSAQAGSKQKITPWILFVIFVFGPCEALIPILMYPAAEGFWWWIAAVVLIFGIVTIATMSVIVALGYLGLANQPLKQFERFSHVLAGLALVVCGLGIQFGL